MTRTDTRDQLVKTGTGIIAEKGFNTTGINAVLTAAGVPKGSFYYYFSSKEDFGLAVIDDFAGTLAQKLDGYLKNPRVAPLQRIRNYLEDEVAAMSDCRCTRGCLIGNLGQELASQNETLRSRLDAVFKDWKARLAACLQAAQDADELPRDRDVEQLAGFLLTGWEGASLRAKVTQSVEPMRTFVTVLFDNVLK